MRKIFFFTALFVVLGSLWLISLWPTEDIKKSEKTTLVLNDTTYAKWENKEYRLIQLRTANNIKIK